VVIQPGCSLLVSGPGKAPYGYVTWGLPPVDKNIVLVLDHSNPIH